MRIARHHTEWLNLVEQSGPFPSVPVLMDAFPQGLDAPAANHLRDAYAAWQDTASGPAATSAFRQWLLHVLTDFLGWPADFILEGQTLPPGLEAPLPVHGEILRPDFALRHRDSGQPPVMLIQLHPPAVKLESALPGHFWKASSATRMAELLRATRIPLGLVTNGEHWMLVHVKDKEHSGFASWFADLWFQEGITLRAFRSLFTLSRFFGVPADKSLPSLLDASRKDQQEVVPAFGSNC